MPAPDLEELMSLYVRTGISDWRNTSDELRKRARECLGADKIADDEAQATETVYTLFTDTNAHKLKFIPMPNYPKGRLDRGFFLPIRRKTAQGHTADFDLFLLVKQKHCLAFRFDASHQQPTTHGYGHVQLTRSLLRRTIEVQEIPGWLPASYPAFPISTSDSLKMFLAMTTAVHGYPNGVVRVLSDTFQKARRMNEMPAYVDILRKLLLD